MPDGLKVEFDDVDDAFVSRLVGTVAAMGGKFVDVASGGAGCVELTMLSFCFGESSVHFDFDNWGSADLRGPAELVNEIRDRLASSNTQE